MPDEGRHAAQVSRSAFLSRRAHLCPCLADVIQFGLNFRDALELDGQIAGAIVNTSA
jgi:hypothetical protein